MTLGFGYASSAAAFVPHVSVSLSRALSVQIPHSSPVHTYLPGALVVVAAYLVVLLILIIFGVCMGWQQPGDGGNGGGGGWRWPRSREPTPPGGRQVDAEDPPQPVCTDDFAAWEEQFRPADERATTGRR